MHTLKTDPSKPSRMSSLISSFMSSFSPQNGQSIRLSWTPPLPNPKTFCREYFTLPKPGKQSIFTGWLLVKHTFTTTCTTVFLCSSKWDHTDYKEFKLLRV